MGVGWGLLAAADVPRAESPPPAAVARRRRRRETRRAGLLGPGGPAARTTRRQGGLVGGLGVVAANEFESRPNTYLNGPNSQLKAAPDESHAPLAAPKKRKEQCRRLQARFSTEHASGFKLSLPSRTDTHLFFTSPSRVRTSPSFLSSRAFRWYPVCLPAPTGSPFTCLGLVRGRRRLEPSPPGATSTVSWQHA